jgi:type I restriction enzyme R subunit
MEHAIRHEIHVRLDDDPVFFTSLRERLEQIIEDRKAKRIDAARQMELFNELKKQARGPAEAAEALGLSETGLAIYGLISERKPLTVAEKTGNAYGKVDESKKELASLLEEQIEPQVSLVDWVHKDDVQREMRRRIKRQLRAAGFADDKKIDATAEGIVELMKRRRGR